MQPVLETQRLRLRPFTLADADAVQRLAGAREIADTTISIPHPYSRSQAERWIAGHADAFAQGVEAHCAVVLHSEGQLVGSVGLREIDPEHAQAELGFWIGTLWWGRGYATEAARRLVQYGFEDLGLNRIQAHHMVRNPASGKVLLRIGMKPEGLLRQRVRKWGVFEDVAIYAILAGDAP